MLSAQALKPYTLALLFTSCVDDRRNVCKPAATGRGQRQTFGNFTRALGFPATPCRIVSSRDQQPDRVQHAMANESVRMMASGRRSRRLWDATGQRQKGDACYECELRYCGPTAGCVLGTVPRRSGTKLFRQWTCVTADLDHTADIQIHSCECRPHRHCAALRVRFSSALSDACDESRLCPSARGTRLGRGHGQCRPGHVQLHDAPLWNQHRA